VSDFLATMIRASRARVAEARQRESDSALRRRATATAQPFPLASGKRPFDLIAEIKRRSPSAGRLDRSASDEMTARARAYAKGGAVAISVLTEPTQFAGSLDDLTAIAGAVDAPVMRKDFVVDPYQLFEARAAGASGCLLIARLLDGELLGETLDAAAAAGLWVLLEAFDETDTERCHEACTIAERVKLELWTGVNARDLETLTIDRGRFARMRRQMPRRTPCVAESGLLGPGHVRGVAALGYQAALVGTALMQSDDPRERVTRMILAGGESVQECACE